MKRIVSSAGHDSSSARLQRRILGDLRALFNDMDELYSIDADGFDALDLAALYNEAEETLRFVADTLEGK